MAVEMVVDGLLSCVAPTNTERMPPMLKPLTAKLNTGMLDALERTMMVADSAPTVRGWNVMLNKPLAIEARVDPGVSVVLTTNEDAPVPAKVID